MKIEGPRMPPIPANDDYREPGGLKGIQANGMKAAEAANERIVQEERESLFLLLDAIDAYTENTTLGREDFANYAKALRKYTGNTALLKSLSEPEIERIQIVLARIG